MIGGLRSRTMKAMPTRRSPHAPDGIALVAILVALSAPAWLAAAPVPVERPGLEADASLHSEVPDDPPGIPARAGARAVAAAPRPSAASPASVVNVNLAPGPTSPATRPTSWTRWIPLT
jgi:hypothetical protein